MTLAELGVALREARESCGYSVEEVASRLKIMVRVVKGIEEGDKSSLPHPVYARGFIRAYAALVGVDEAEVRAVLACLTDPGEEPQSIQLAPSTRQDRRSSGNLLPMLVVLCAIGFGVFWFRGPLIDVANQLIALVENATLPSTATPAASDPENATKDAPASEAAVPGPSSQAIPATPATPATPAAPISPSTSVSAMSVPPAFAADLPQTSAQTSAQVSLQIPAQSQVNLRAASGKPVELNADGLPAGLAQTTSALPTDSDVPGTGAAVFDGVDAATTQDTTLTLQTGESQTDLTKAGKGKHQIIMTAVAECWVHSSADGTFTRQFSLKKGETFALSFESKLVVKLGNAGGVRIKYDGEELAPPGKMGQVRTITFPGDVAEIGSTASR